MSNLRGVKPKPTVQDWTLLDAESEPVHLTGRLLGRASSIKDGHNHASEHVVSGRCSACRWFEVMIFDVSMDEEAGADFLVYTCGKTIIAGELDRPRFKWTDSPREVIECLRSEEHTSELQSPC